MGEKDISISISKGMQLKYKINKNRFCRQTEYQKHNKCLTIMSILYRFFHDFAFYLFIAIIAIAFFIFYLKYEVIGKNDLFSFIDDEKSVILFNTAITLFGITLTAYSIVFALKNLNFLNKNQFGKLLKSGRIYSLRYLLFLDLVYLAMAIFSFCTGGYTSNTIILIIFLIFTIIRLVLITIKSNSQIYFELNMNFMSANPFKKRKDNFIELSKRFNEKNEDDIIEMIVLKSLTNGYIRGIYNYFDDLMHLISYRKNDNGFDLELLDLYLKKYFSNVNSDAQIVGTILFVHRFDSLLTSLAVNNMKELYTNYLILFLDHFKLFLKKKAVQRRFIIPNEELIYLEIELRKNILTSVLLRNIIFLENLKLDYKLLNENFKKNMDDTYSAFDKNKIERQLECIFEDITRYKNSIYSFQEKINKALEKKENQIKEENEKLSSIQKTMDIVKDKIEKGINTL